MPWTKQPSGYVRRKQFALRVVERCSVGSMPNSAAETAAVLEGVAHHEHLLIEP
jgi:hypothetical protein